MKKQFDFPKLVAEIYELLPKKWISPQENKKVGQSDTWHSFAEFVVFGCTLEVSKDCLSLSDGDPICNNAMQTFYEEYPFCVEAKTLAKRMVVEFHKQQKDAKRTAVEFDNSLQGVHKLQKK